MMPDKSQASDDARNEPADDAALDAQSDDAVVHVQGESSPETTQAESSHVHNDVNVAAPAGAKEDDPLGFGHQRMGEGEGEADDELDQLRAQLAEAEERASENWDRLLRLQAEMENQRKRAQNEVTRVRKFALESIVKDLLPVKDSLELGLAAAQAEDADPRSIVEGAELTLKMLAQVFEKNSIEEVNPLDEKFNPDFHEAVSMQEIEGKPSNTVAAVMQKGYTLNDRVIRAAMVMVAK